MTPRNVRVSALLTPQQAAERLGISPRTLINWAYERRVPCTRVGRLYRFSEEQLAQIAREQRPLRAAQRRV